MKFFTKNSWRQYFDRMQVSALAVIQAGLIFGGAGCAEKQEPPSDAGAFAYEDRAPIQREFKGSIGELGQYPENWSFHVKSGTMNAPQKSGKLSWGADKKDESGLSIASQNDGSVILAGRSTTECAFASTCTDEQDAFEVAYRPGSIEGKSNDAGLELVWDLKVSSQKRGGKLIEGQIESTEATMSISVQVSENGGIYGELTRGEHVVVMTSSYAAEASGEIAVEAVVSALIVSAIRYSADLQ